MVGGKVDGKILSGTRSEKPKILFGTRDEKRKNLFGTKLQFQQILFGSQRVKTINVFSAARGYCHNLERKLTAIHISTLSPSASPHFSPLCACTICERPRRVVAQRLCSSIRLCPSISVRPSVSVHPSASVRPSVHLCPSPLSVRLCPSLSLIWGNYCQCHLGLHGRMTWSDN